MAYLLYHSQGAFNMMDQIVLFIQSNADVAPYLIFGTLFLAGFNIPVSEDAMIFMSALLSVNRPDLAKQIFTGLFLGAYVSDVISYSLGRFLGPKLFRIKFFAKIIDQKTLDRMGSFYKKYGIVTLVVGRFIPFGVRNALFLTAGFSKMHFIKFALADLIATAMSVSSFFYLYYTYGEVIIDYVMKWNLVIFAIFATSVGIYYIKKRKKNSLKPS
jgi:membrane protein DedA with SNARE-associated domain